ncbi:alpha/beta hydrolase [Rhodococcus sp. AD45-ID]|uniref:alpha/beta hydrolase family protein n=1 Tax=Rhodococcus TaxID=1827 RepID=UPI0005D3F79B|nr:MULTISPECIES: alpha/beta fold hydrolase [Rhodococcus]KJF23842.1 putative esterase [Rhodococcus sp. AD45]MCE4266445.1 alpha/beta fold hydrolase [Rhodococcus globerulus]PSR42220.1 alpha/beta hydrolase [Rhodococcus sp. AD45-ID]ROZ49961.1 alpha/beta fold hydrolase [Rhodococcus sp. WS3]
MTTFETVDRGELQGFLHRPDTDPIATLALTHGAGSNCDTVLLRAVADGFAEAGVQVLRFDLAYRVRRPKGPPHPSRAAEDRSGIADVVATLRKDYPSDGPLLLGGHSYGGRQSSMAAAENPGLVDGLILLSYPLHPPKKPEKLRTEHLPALTTPTVVVHGSKDEFATTDEMQSALDLIPAATTLVEFDGAKHDLGVTKFPVVEQTVAAAFGLFGIRPR